MQGAKKKMKELYYKVIANVVTQSSKNKFIDFVTGSPRFARDDAIIAAFQ